MSIPFSDFQKLDLRIGTIIAAERVLNSEKLVRLGVDLGSEKRQLVAGIANVYTPEELVGRQIVVVVNLEPRKLMGLESQGMLLAATDPDGNPVLLKPEREVPPGAPVC